MYKLIANNPLNIVQSVLRLDDNAMIPLEKSNTDYQEYLKWIAEGNTPEPADQ